MGQAREQGERRRIAERRRIVVAFGAIVFIGVFAGAAGVLLPAQATDYGVDKSTVSLIFVSFAVGYIACATANGALIHRIGLRAHLTFGTAVALVALALMAVRPTFALLLVLQAVLGFGLGAFDAGLNSYLSTLSGSTALLNYFHAFFGVGALLGPIIAAGILSAGSAWTVVYALLAVACGALLAGFWLYPRSLREGTPVARPRLTVALGHRVVWIAAAFLGIYVGIEAGVGNWGFTFLTEDRGQEVLAAGWVVSGYWFGLTLGRFVLNAAAERVGIGVVTLTATCLGGVLASSLCVWLAPSFVATTVGMVALGFFLGPLFPTMIAVVPRLVPESLVATVIGILVAMSIAGSAVFPWIVGASAERVGAWSLLPITVALTALLGMVWWRIAVRLRAPDPGRVTVEA